MSVSEGAKRPRRLSLEGRIQWQVAQKLFAVDSCAGAERAAVRNARRGVQNRMQQRVEDVVHQEYRAKENHCGAGPCGHPPRPVREERTGAAVQVGVQGACVEQKALPKSNAKDSRQCERGLLHGNRSAAPVIAATRGARRGLRPLPLKARTCAQAAAPKEENRYSMQSESVAHARKVRAPESCG